MQPQNVGHGPRGRWKRVIGGVMTATLVLAVPALAVMFLDVNIFASGPGAAVTDKGDGTVGNDSPVLLKNWEDAAQKNQAKQTPAKQTKPKQTKPKQTKPKTTNKVSNSTTKPKPKTTKPKPKTGNKKR